MINAYRITDPTLRNIVKFNWQLSKIKMLSISETSWFNQLISIVVNESSKSYGYPNFRDVNTWALKPTKDPDLQRYPKNVLTEYKRYKYVLKLLNSGNLAKKDINGKTLMLINSLLVHGTLSYSKLRTKKRSIQKYIYQDNIERYIDIPVKMKINLLNTKFDNLISLLQNESITHELRSALVHLNFAQVQPFEDGNGRTSMILDRLILREKDKSSLFIMLEDFFIKNYHLYYDLLASTIDSRDATEWLEFFTAGLVFSVERSMEILRLISGGSIDLYNDTIIQLTDREKDVVSIFNTLKQASSAEISRELRVTRQAAGNIIHSLESKKMLTRIGTQTSVRFKLSRKDSTDLITI